jgi:hypothetical protein
MLVLLHAISLKESKHLVFITCSVSLQTWMTYGLSHPKLGLCFPTYRKGMMTTWYVFNKLFLRLGQSLF